MPEELCAVAIMAKASLAGSVKTRLVPPLSYEEAAELNTCCLADVAANLAAASAQAPIDAYAAYQVATCLFNASSCPRAVSTSRCTSIANAITSGSVAAAHSASAPRVGDADPSTSSARDTHVRSISARP